MKSYWKVWILGGTICLLLLCPYQNTATGDTSIESNIVKIYGEDKAEKLAGSGNYLYVQTGDNEIRVFENDHNKSVFRTNRRIRSFTAIDRHLVFSTGKPPLTIVSFENYSDPYILSTITNITAGGPIEMSAYGQYVYAANNELGFYIFNLTDLSHPHQVGRVFLYNWHARYVFIVSHYGFFGGDWSIGTYYLRTDPLNPLLLQTIITEFDPLSLVGTPAVSNSYFVLNLHRDHSENYLFQIFPLVNLTTLGKPSNITYPKEKGYSDCVLIDETILVVGGTNNTVSIFEITPKKELQFHSEIFLGVNGSIKELYRIKDTNEFYIADGANGLLKLSLTITRDRDSSSRVSGFTHEFLILAANLLILMYVKFYRRKRMN